LTCTKALPKIRTPAVATVPWDAVPALCMLTKQRERAMSKPVTEILRTVAHGLHLSAAEVLQQGLRSLLEHQLREVKAEICAISGRYGVSSIKEMEARYREGTLDEADSWQDLQRLDHLEHKRDSLLELLKVVT
jgi:hypothetical protein